MQRHLSCTGYHAPARLANANRRNSPTNGRSRHHLARSVAILGLILCAVSAGCDEVSTEPSVTGVSPATADGQAEQTLVVTGENLRAPLEITLLDEAGQPLRPSLQMHVTPDGRQAEAILPPGLPPLAEGQGFVMARIRIRNGDGRMLLPPHRIRLGEPPIRSFDGTGNNEGDTTLGSAGIPLRRLANPDYADGANALAGASRLNPRLISNTVCAQDASVPNAQHLSDMFWQWGQFLDHDLDLTPGATPSELAPILVPTGDPWFDPSGSGTAVINFNRSAFDPTQTPRQQLNAITAFIDASQVYGSDAATALALRALDGTGRLKTSAGDLLPLTAAGFFQAGDIRVNEQLGLTSMHVLFMREHNRLADQFAARNPTWTDDQIYEAARRMVGAEMQLITYREFIPLLLGHDALRPYRGYRPDVDPSIINEFATAAYRFGHSMLSATLQRLDANLREIPQGHLALRDAFFQPRRLVNEGGIEPVIRGLATQVAQELDVFVIDDVRNFLFGTPGAGGLDLAALNIQRGRDHGLPSYNQMRTALGLSRRASFAQMSSRAEVQQRLAAAYATVDDVDLWIGALAEDHVPGAVVGETMFTILRIQFERVRDGDRFWFELVLAGPQLEQVRQTWLIDVIRRNCTIGDELERDVWHIPGFRVPLPRR